MDIFRSVMLGPDPDNSLPEYWKHNCTTKWFQEHPLLPKLSLAELHMVIPLEVHGDDAELHKRRSFSISTVSSALTTASTWDHKLLLSCFDNSAAGESTSTEIDCWICWGLVCATAGVYLDHDWHGRAFSKDYMPQLFQKAGRRIAGKFRFVFAGHKGDQVYLHKCYKFENYWTSQEVCRACAVPKRQLVGSIFKRSAPFHLKALKDGSSPMGYVHYGPAAAHRSTLFGLLITVDVLIGGPAFCKWPCEALHHGVLHNGEVRRQSMDPNTGICNRAHMGGHLACLGPGNCS